MFMALPFRYSTRPVFLHATHRLSTVMRGLDPRIHDERQQAKQYCLSWWRTLMDCRVKPGNDG
jgi:hypothetical protein